MSLGNKKIAFIGGGQMAEGILKGILEAEILDSRNSIVISEPVANRAMYLTKHYRIAEVFFDNKKAVELADVIILAVKPNKVGDVCSEIAPVLTEDKLLISIAAGINLFSIQEHLKEGKSNRDFRVIRVMPNICATVSQAMTGICADSPYKREDVKEEDLDIVKQIFGACGEVEVIREEKIHALTGVSGSGPAFHALIASAMQMAGVEQGLSADVSLRLTAQTMKGVAEMLSRGISPEEIIKMTSSPGGTTIKGIRVLEEWGVRAALMEAIATTAEKSKEMGDEKRK